MPQLLLQHISNSQSCRRHTDRSALTSRVQGKDIWLFADLNSWQKKPAVEAPVVTAGHFNICFLSRASALHLHPFLERVAADRIAGKVCASWVTCTDTRSAQVHLQLSVAIQRDMCNCTVIVCLWQNRQDLCNLAVADPDLGVADFHLAVAGPKLAVAELTWLRHWAH